MASGSSRLKGISPSLELLQSSFSLFRKLLANGQPARWASMGRTLLMRWSRLTAFMCWMGKQAATPYSFLERFFANHGVRAGCAWIPPMAMARTKHFHLYISKVFVHLPNICENCNELLQLQTLTSLAGKSEDRNLLPFFPCISFGNRLE